MEVKKISEMTMEEFDALPEMEVVWRYDPSKDKYAADPKNARYLATLKMTPLMEIDFVFSENDAVILAREMRWSEYPKKALINLPMRAYSYIPRHRNPDGKRETWVIQLIYSKKFKYAVKQLLSPQQQIFVKSVPSLEKLFIDGRRDESQGDNYAKVA